MPTRELCIKCGSLLAEPQKKVGYHVNCEPIEFGKVPGSDPVATALKTDLTNAILWVDGNSTRSQQKALGPSELGSACDRKVAYGLTGTPEINAFKDPWPAIVGTAIHGWLENALGAYQEHHRINRWITELTVHPDELVVGHLDLYDQTLNTVIDWKSLGTQKMRDWKKQGPPDKHLNQVMLYAKGAIRQGLPVEKVALIGVPRAGWLSDMTPYVYDYDESRADAALARMYSIAQQVINIGADRNDLKMVEIPAEPDKGDCQWCPWFDMKNWGAGCEGVK